MKGYSLDDWDRCISKMTGLVRFSGCVVVKTYWNCSKEEPEPAIGHGCPRLKNCSILNIGICSHEVVRVSMLIPVHYQKQPQLACDHQTGPRSSGRRCPVLMNDIFFYIKCIVGGRDVSRKDYGKRVKLQRQCNDLGKVLLKKRWVVACRRC